jgi:hypothetical protein
MKKKVKEDEGFNQERRNNRFWKEEKQWLPELM